MTVSVDPGLQRQCSRYAEPFLEETPHATPPGDARSSEWVGFGVSEAGQLELANRDKRLAKRVLTTCEQETAAAVEAAAKRAKPWWRRIF